MKKLQTKTPSEQLQDQLEPIGDQITMMDYEEYRYHVLASYHHKDLLPKEIAKKLLDEADSIGYEDINSGERFEREAEYLVHIAHELTQGKWDHEFRIMGI